MAQQNLVATNFPSTILTFSYIFIFLSWDLPTISDISGQWNVSWADRCSHSSWQAKLPWISSEKPLRFILELCVCVHVCCLGICIWNAHIQKSLMVIMWDMYNGYLSSHCYQKFGVFCQVSVSMWRFFVFVARKFLGRRLGGLFGFTTPWLLQRSRPSAVDRGAVVHYCWWLKPGNTWDTTKRLLIIGWREKLGTWRVTSLSKWHQKYKSHNFVTYSSWSLHSFSFSIIWVCVISWGLTPLPDADG